MENLRCFIRLFVAALFVAVGAVRASAVPAGIGVTVNGVDIGVTSGGAGATAWTYSDSTNLVLSGAGPYVISGTNGANNLVSIHVSNDCVVVASNLVITARYTGSSARPYAPFDCGTYKVDLRLWSESGTTNQIRGGSWVPGIAVVSNKAGIASLAITNLNKSAALYVYAENGVAAIGGGYNESCGAVTISGGDVFAKDSRGGAGIGGGDNGNGGLVTITGGRVRAVTTGDASGIGGGYGTGKGGTVKISGGTVYASGSATCTDIGGYSVTDFTGTNIFTGGSIYAAHGAAQIIPAPANAAGTNVVEAVFATGTAFTQAYSDIAAKLGALGYGTNDIVLLDAAGSTTGTCDRVYAWLPASLVKTNAEGIVTGLIRKIGVTVNGVDIGGLTGGAGETAWTYSDATNLVLSGAGPYVISGYNGTNNVVGILASNDCTVVASNLVIDLNWTGSYSPAVLGVAAFDCGTNAVDLRLWSGTGLANAFMSGYGRVGIRVVSNNLGCASLSITNLNADAALLALAGKFYDSLDVGGGAGIGGDRKEGGGTVTINGGTVTAQTLRTGGAGIGGGVRGTGGTVTINNGTVMALGGLDGAGIGGGLDGAGGTVTINGGTVTAQGNGGDDIGSGSGYGHRSLSATGTGRITGGNVRLVGGRMSPAPVNSAGTPLHCLAVSGLSGNAALAAYCGKLAALDPSYGTNGIVLLNAAGSTTGTCDRVYAWLPDGTYQNIPSNGDETQIDGGDVSTDPVGVTVDGVDISAGAGAGWVFTGGEVILTNRAASYVVAGNNVRAGTATAVTVAPRTDCGVVASNLTLDVSAFFGAPAFDCGTNAVDLMLWSDPGTTNIFWGGFRSVGIRVASNNLGVASLSITNLNESAALLAQAKRIKFAGWSLTPGGGIGGRYDENVGESCGRVTFRGGYVVAGDATSWSSGVGGGYGGETAGNGGVVTVHGGTLVARANSASAIGGGGGYHGGMAGTFIMDGGTVDARNTDFGTGIGAGFCNSGIVLAGGTVEIHGGTVTAVGGKDGAGIGAFGVLRGGMSADAGTITITGGRVTAIGYTNETGILYHGSVGLGANVTTTSAGKGSITISGGTVTAIGATNRFDLCAATNTFTGGSICLTHDFVTEAPVNAAGTTVAEVIFATGTAFTPAYSDIVTNLVALGYGTNEIVLLDAAGSTAGTCDRVYAWLPAGLVTTNAEGIVTGLIRKIGVTVNGVDIGVTSGGAGATAWTYSDSTNLVLSGAGPYVISGTNGTKNVVSIHASNDCVVVASNLVITARYTGYSASRPFAPFDCGTNAVNLRLWSESGTTNQFKGGSRVPGIAVVSNAAGIASISITNLNENGALYVYAYKYAAAIGGGDGESCGAVTIAGGDVFANVSDGGAGIGGGDNGNGGTVTITGGRVRAVTTGGAAGIGGGYGTGNGGTVKISGGTVYASGYETCTDIGGCSAVYSTGTNIFTGGSIFVAHGAAKVIPAPANAAGAALTCLTNACTAEFLAQLAAVGYGTNGIVALDGKVYPWLAAGQELFFAGEAYRLDIAAIDMLGGRRLAITFRLVKRADPAVGFAGTVAGEVTLLGKATEADAFAPIAGLTTVSSGPFVAGFARYVFELPAGSACTIFKAVINPGE